MVVGVTSVVEIERPRLTRSIRGASPGGVCLLLSPRGYGASTAVRHAVQSDSVLWLEPAPGETLEAALALILDGAKVEAAAIREHLVTSGVRWLVLDGLTEEPPPAIIKAVYEALTPETRLVITGCVALEGLLRDPVDTTLITREQLAFTQLEARAMLEQVGTAGTPAQLEAAVEWCEGWPLALKVAAARLRHSVTGEPDAWMVGEGADALISPWLDTLDDQQRDFLVATALLEEIEVGSADAVRGVADSGEILAELTRRPGLLWRRPATPDGVVVWHRHRLLTEVLRARAAGSDGRREAHSRAARWYEEQGRVEAAVFHLIEAGRKADAGALLRDHEGELLAVGDARRTLGWYRRLTPQGWSESAEHWLRLGWGHLFSGDPQGARESLVHLAALSQAIPDETPSNYSRSWFEGNHALLEARFAGYCGDPVTMARKAAQARSVFDPGTSNAHQLAPLDHALGLLWQDDLAGARETLSSIDILGYPNAVMREVVLPGIDALCAWNEGRVRQARHLVTRADAWLDDSGPELDARTLGALGLARALVTAEAGDLEGALVIANNVEEGARARGHMSETTAAALARSRILLWMGDARAARAAVSGAREELLLAFPTSAMFVLVDQLEALVLLRLGEGARAERLIRRLPNSPVRDLLAMRLLSASGAAPAARALTSMRPSTPRIAALRRLQLAEYFLGRDETLTRSHLYAAAGIAAEHGMTLLLRDYPALRRAAQEAAARTAHDGLTALLQAERAAVTPGVPKPPPPVQVAPVPGVNLSAGERELLELLPTRHSNAQIAEHLGVSLNTVKTRLQRLYRKLGVSNRDDALAAVAQGRAG